MSLDQQIMLFIIGSNTALHDIVHNIEIVVDSVATSHQVLGAHLTRGQQKLLVAALALWLCALVPQLA